MNETERPRVLVVSDDGDDRQQLVHELVGHGHVLDVVTESEMALQRIERDGPEVVVVGCGLGVAESLELIERGHRTAGRHCAFIAVLEPARSAAVADLLRAGADQVLLWPDHRDALAVAVRRALEKPRLAREVDQARDGVLNALSVGKVERIVGAHPAMQRLLSKVMQAAQSRATVLIHGETGTGKELIAAAVHEHSKRSRGPFVRLNCAALADTVLESELFGHERGSFTGATARRKGRFEQADGGTLLLDEVSEINRQVQVKLLRFLQEREFERVGGNETLHVDVRIVAATNRDLKQLVEDGRFREDLYYRLNVVRLEVPPLRARPSDVTLLADHFLRQYAEENEKTVHGFDQRARNALLAHPWPGNVRELQNAIEQAVVLCEGDTIEAEDLPIAPAPAELDSLKMMIPGITLAELERYAILKTLEACGGSPTRAAAVLGISRRTIQYRLQQWGLSRPSKLRGERDAPSSPLPLPETGLESEPH
ncbi:MAG: sigma-54 dependent transcriptional regulator [Myxococcales bacterium]|nr:sigma-54 dependent transcriptional regulator [Myxococcales bacterium]